MKYKEVIEKSKEFDKREVRQIFYDLARWLLTQEKIVEAVLVLLYTWNIKFYNNKPADMQHLIKTKEILKSQEKNLVLLKGKCLDDLDFDGEIKSDDIKKPIKKIITEIYMDFVYAYSYVGASKAMHLLLPNLFIPWDTSIRREYDLKECPEEYINFLILMQTKTKEIIKDFCKKNNCSREEAVDKIFKETGKTIPKLIDEYNYMTYSFNKEKKTSIRKESRSEKMRRFYEMLEEERQKIGKE